jgi:hypothetical protein
MQLKFNKWRQLCSHFEIAIEIFNFFKRCLGLKEIEKENHLADSLTAIV